MNNIEHAITYRDEICNDISTILKKGYAGTTVDEEDLLMFLTMLHNHIDEYIQRKNSKDTGKSNLFE